MNSTAPSICCMVGAHVKSGVGIQWYLTPRDSQAALSATNDGAISNASFRQTTAPMRSAAIN